VRGLVFGVAAGVFLHVAVDLLPECTAGSESCPVDAADHEDDRHLLADRMRTHAAVSAVLGGAAVVLAWAMIA
jgi:ZIP family zinc transporter